MAARKRRSRWADDAALQSLVRFGPEQSGLRELARQAAENRSTSIAQAHGTARGLENAIDVARPEVAKIYDEAGLAQARTASVVGPDLATLGPVANSIRAAAQFEQAQGGRHLTEMRAGNLADLTNRRVQARSGEQFAVQNAQRQFVGDMAKVLARQQDLAGERGAFEASTVNSLEQAALERGLRNRTSLRSTRSAAANSRRSASQSERNSLRSSGIDPDTGKPIPGGKLDPKAKKDRTATGAKAVSQDKHLEYQTSIQNIANAASKYKGRLSRRQIVQTLVNGRPAQTIWVDRTTKAQLGENAAKTNPNAMKVHLPSIPQHNADIKMTAALDVALDGHLSRATQKKLAQAGFRIKDLNLPTYGEWKRTAGPDAGLSYDQRRRRSSRAAGRRVAVVIPALSGGPFGR